jgi:hypothetical protein
MPCVNELLTIAEPMDWFCCLVRNITSNSPLDASRGSVRFCRELRGVHFSAELDLVRLTVFLSNDEVRSNSIRKRDMNRSGYAGD